SLRAANVMIEDGGRPWLTDFSFSELAATRRQQDLDLAELLASLATLVGADRAVSSAAAVIGAQRLAPAVPLLRPAGWTSSRWRASSGSGPAPCWPSPPRPAPSTSSCPSSRR